MRALVALLLGLLIGLGAPARASELEPFAGFRPDPALIGQPLAGIVVQVRDGDGLILRTPRGVDHEIRLFGIDAPETDQVCIADRRRVPCGEEARDALYELAQGRQVICRPVAISWNRLVSQCTAGAIDLGRVLVREGYAIAYRGYSIDYVPDETDARAARRGIWRGTMDTPACWRRNRAECPCPIQSCTFTAR